jgi:hypothetical protein
MRRILWDEPLQKELEQVIATYDTREKQDWKNALDEIVNKAFPGTGDQYRIVFGTNEQAKPKKRKTR